MGVQLPSHDELRTSTNTNQPATQSSVVGMPDSQIADGLSTESANGASQHGDTSAKSDQIAPTPTDLHTADQQRGQTIPLEGGQGRGRISQTNAQGSGGANQGGGANARDDRLSGEEYSQVEIDQEESGVLFLSKEWSLKITYLRGKS